MGTFWHRLYSACPLPSERPIVEDQRYWTCNICGQVWMWDWIEDRVAVDSASVADLGGPGWVKITPTKE